MKKPCPDCLEFLSEEIKSGRIKKEDVYQIDVEDDMKKIYMVWREGGDMPKVAHDSMDEAMEEANRLADKHRGDIFHVLATTAQALSSKPTIEVGDVVKKKGMQCVHTTCKVISAIEPMVFRDFNSGSQCSCMKDSKHFTLIRKGPKVHTFKDAMLVGRHYGNPPSYHSLNIVFEGDKDINFPPNFTLTLTEEV